MIGLERVSAQSLSDTIGAIYDCALDPQRWTNAIRRIVELADGAGGGMCVHHIKDVANDQLFEFGYTPEFSRLIDQNIALTPFPATSMVANVGDVTTSATMWSDEEMFESRFYREILKPHGYLDFIGIVGLKTNNRVASLHASRSDQAPRYGEHEINLFKLLSPHVVRTLAISDALDIRTLKSEMLEATLDGLAAGVFLTARNGRVVYMNAAAERQVKTGNALRIVGNRLVPSDPEARAALAKAIDDAARDQAGVEADMRGRAALALRDAGGTGYVATLLPLDQGQRQNIVAPFAASVAIFVQEPAEMTPMPAEAFARLYGLTGGELRVLLALAQGLGGKEAADMLGISEPTMRTHLQRMFSKTGTARQTELMQLLQRAAPPTKAA